MTKVYTVNQITTFEQSLMTFTSMIKALNFIEQKLNGITAIKVINDNYFGGYKMYYKNDYTPQEWKRLLRTHSKNETTVYSGKKIIKFNIKKIEVH